MSGADVAWVTDEVDDHALIDRVLTNAARWEAIGSAVGLLVFGALAWAVDRDTSIIVSGVAILVLGGYVARFPERRFTRVRIARWRASKSILRAGIALARHDREILVMLGATFLVNGADAGWGRLYAKRLVTLGLPESPDPIVWYTVLGLAMFALGAVVLHLLESRVDGTGGARRVYVGASVIGTVGILVLAYAPNSETAAAGVLLVGGLSRVVLRLVSTIWVNRRTVGDTRATVHSILAQAEYLGEIILGLCLALLVRATTVTTSLAGAAGLMLAAAVLVRRRQTSD